MSALADRSARPLRMAGASDPTAATTATPAAPRRPVLQVVSAPAPARSLVPYVVSLVVVLVGAMIGALVLNISMAQTAFEIQAAQVELQDLERHAASLQAEVDAAGSPAGLQAAAVELGMVPADQLAHLTLADGTITEAPAR